MRVLKETVDVPVVSNGNVRTWEDVQENRRTTGADGVMVGEALLANPWCVRQLLFGPREKGEGGGGWISVGLTERACLCLACSRTSRPTR